MAKTKTTYVCQSCGYTTAKWMGKCPQCESWDSFVEEKTIDTKGKSFLPVTEHARPVTIAEVRKEQKIARLVTGIGEFDRVLGGGIVPGSLVLLGGAPGIGKSTIALDAAMRFAKRDVGVFYVSGEESEAQTAMRAERLGGGQANLLIMTATDLGLILEQAQALEPQLLIIDSIQTMYNSELDSAAGSVGQLRECTAKLLRFAKQTGIAIVIVGHVTKEGNIAGPRLLEHMVDVVLQFEGDRSYSYRILRALKNRFGSTGESGIFSMEEDGLKEIDNPSGIFLEKRENQVPGSVVTAILEGNRPLLAEIQALVARTPYGLPRRTAVGIDYNRVNMLLAVLEKRMGLDFSTHDAYVNVVGGAKINEPSVDLAVVAALVSSYRNRPIPMGTLALGEVGLTGELRRIGFVEQRIKEAMKLGFHRFVIPKLPLKMQIPPQVQVVAVHTVEEALNVLFNEV